MCSICTAHFTLALAKWSSQLLTCSKDSARNLPMVRVVSRTRACCHTDAACSIYNSHKS
jgi:hypothetical protein